MKIKLTLGLALLSLSSALFAQSNYKQAIGVRLSPASNYDVFAASYKMFLAEQPALEFNLGVGGTGMLISQTTIVPLPLVLQLPTSIILP